MVTAHQSPMRSWSKLRVSNFPVSRGNDIAIAHMVERGSPPAYTELF
jgi:hypothetical protein